MKKLDTESVTYRLILVFFWIVNVYTLIRGLVWFIFGIAYFTRSERKTPFNTTTFSLFLIIGMFSIFISFCGYVFACTKNKVLAYVFMGVMLTLTVVEVSLGISLVAVLIYEGGILIVQIIPGLMAVIFAFFLITAITHDEPIE
ncbi:unnamed protein product [Rodentolepis nana]|uniref:Conserved plasma membrane protein n=1 Tax=Rodentolepis nana TaxID=102285 RepID=A0A0R3TPZ1_RODNA|nr:unnamed protein product [Rodentolepis nana]